MTKKLLTKSTEDFDIAKPRGVELKELLRYDHLGGNTLFEDNGLKKHNKVENLQELETKLEKDDYRIYMSNYTNIAIIVNFMSAIRKVPLNALECMWNMVIKVAEANQIDVVFDSYIENSIKESTRTSRSNDTEPMEYVNLLLESPPPIELERSWAFSKKKRKSCRFYHMNFLNRKPKKRTLP